MAKKKSTKKNTKKTAKKTKAASKRKSYPLALKKKVLSAIRKGMTHSEAAKSFDVVIHNIPVWIKKHT